MAAPAFGSAGTQLQGSGSSMNVDVPDDVAAGNIIVVTAFIDDGDVTSITGLPSGFAHAPDSPVLVNAFGSGGRPQLAVMWKRATGADDTGTTYDFTLSASVYRNAQAIRYTGAIAAGDPWDVTNSAEAGGTNVTDTPAVSDTTTVADTLLIWGAVNWGGGAWTPPAGFTERRDSGDQVCTVADKDQAVAGATGSVVGTCAGSNKSGAWLGALKSAVAESTGDPAPTWTRSQLPGRIGPDRRVYLPRRFDEGTAAAPLAVVADTATLVLSGVDPAMGGTGTASVATDTATLALSGIDVTAAGTGTASVTADTATLSLSGVDATAAGTGATSITTDTATLVLSGVDVAVSGGASGVTADPATLTLSGVDTTFAGTGAASTTPDTAVLVLSGVDVTLTAGTSLTADTAVLTLTGLTPTVTGTGAALIAPDTALLGLLGVTSAFAGTGTTSTAIDPGNLEFSGVDVGAFSGERVTPPSRTYLVDYITRTRVIGPEPRTWPIPPEPRTVR